MVSGIGGGSNWDMARLRNDELQRQQSTKQIDELQQQQAAQQLEEAQKLQQEQSASAPQDEDWAKIQQEYQERQVQFQFDPNQDYQWQLDENNKIMNKEVDFNVSASMTKMLYNDVINSVEELMKSMVNQDEALKTAETNKSHKQADFAAEWQKDTVNEALKLNAQNITELADQDLAKQVNEVETKRPQLTRIDHVNQAQKEQNARALRIDDPRQRFANMMPQNRPPLEPKPVDQTQKTAETNKIRDTSLSFDLKARMMMGQQRMAAASVGAAQTVSKPKDTQPASQPKAVTATQESRRSQFNYDAAKKTVQQSPEQNDNNVKMPLEQATRTSARFASYLAQSATFGISTDINALVQYVIREAYIDGIQDLVFYRDKVVYNTESKKAVRGYLSTARNELTRARTSGSKAAQQRVDDYKNSRAAALADYTKQAADNDKDQDWINKQMETWDASHPAPSPTDINNWINEYSNQAIQDGSFTPMVLDQTQNPPLMVKDSSIKIESTDDLESYIQNQEAELASLGDDAQLANTDLQNIMQKQQQLISMMSNISKLLSDTAKSIIRNLG